MSRTASKDMLKFYVKKMKKVIDDNNITGQEAARRIGAGEGYLNDCMSRAEYGMGRASKKYLDKFCEVFDVDLKWLCTRDKISKKETIDEGQMELPLDEMAAKGFVSVEAEVVDGLKELIHQAKLTLQMVEAALGGI